MEWPIQVKGIFNWWVCTTLLCLYSHRDVTHQDVSRERAVTPPYLIDHQRLSLLSKVVLAVLEDVPSKDESIPRCEELDGSEEGHLMI